MNHPEQPKRYRLLGHERIVLTRQDLEILVRDGLLDTKTVVIGDGEAFAVPIDARPEFRHLMASKRRRPPSR
jgi:hypothetical protein